MTAFDAVNPAARADDTLRLSIFMAPITYALARRLVLGWWPRLETALKKVKMT